MVGCLRLREECCIPTITAQLMMCIYNPTSERSCPGYWASLMRPMKCPYGTSPVLLKNMSCNNKASQFKSSFE